uniref:MYB transcription factor n=1 Tax=Gentiana triflora TaxID=55190 RepID=W6JQG2_GENTR|nr:MYB transcription factor [Gentiana triflora]
MRIPSCCCENKKLNRGSCSKKEDQKLTNNYIKKHGDRCYHLPKAAGGIHRCGKSCRVKWVNYKRAEEVKVKRGNFGEDEEDLFIKLHALLGNRWSLIAGRLPGRSEKEVKKYWNSHLKRKLISMGIDPDNHRPHGHALFGPGCTYNNNNNNNNNKAKGIHLGNSESININTADNINIYVSDAESSAANYSSLSRDS